MRSPPHIGFLPDGRRLHLQDGPIDLVIEASGSLSAIQSSYRRAARRFSTILDELCEELVALRAVAQQAACPVRGRVARRMHYAVEPFADLCFITPMAAVAGAVAEEVLEAMTSDGDLVRAYVNNGGDIALYLDADSSFAIGIVDKPDTLNLLGNVRIQGSDGIGGVATSGWRGRSFSLGIADAVTVLAKTAAAADAAATIIANAVDLPGHPAVLRVPARSIQLDSDLGDRLVTRGVGLLTEGEIDTALAEGASCAAQLADNSLIRAAALHIAGRTRTIGIDPRRSVLDGKRTVATALEYAHV